MNKVELLEGVNEIVKKIIEGYNPEKIILFGSYAHGKPFDRLWVIGRRSWALSPITYHL